MDPSDGSNSNNFRIFELMKQQTRVMNLLINFTGNAKRTGKVPQSGFLVHV